MAKKTYGVKGMIEWHALIPFGKSTMSVKFTGGTITGYGISPAKFITSDPIAQNVIERSDLFKNGKIKLLAVYEEPGDKTSAATASQNGVETSKAKKQIKVASLEDAREILKEKGVSWRELKTTDAIKTAAAGLGIEFILE